MGPHFGFSILVWYVSLCVSARKGYYVEWSSLSCLRLEGVGPCVFCSSIQWVFTKGNDLMKQNPGHQMSHKEDRDWTIFEHAGPSATHLRLFPSRWDHLLWTNKQTNNPTNKQANKNNNNNNNLDTFVKKKGFFMEKLSARGYNDAELSRADSSINFEDRQHFIKEKLKSSAIRLVFNTKYNRNFAGKYIRQALLKGPCADYILIPQGSTGSSKFFDIKWKATFFWLQKESKILALNSL